MNDQNFKNLRLKFFLIWKIRDFFSRFLMFYNENMFTLEIEDVREAT